ncbi:MAG: M1 family metallopeptidase [Candidatus Aenigmarchaeota archaeon]|nr:M1 family metallopeptidase [Candidatus Aenigmarchaeota archaeon]
MTSEFKLPAGIFPVNYDLSFDVDLDEFKFYGEETIDLEITKPVSRISLNSINLKIKTAKIVYGNKILKPKIKLDNKNEILTLSLGAKIKGHVKLSMEFIGDLNNKLIGFYRSKYIDKNKEKYLATTQFEAIHAREAFPCFDEPAYKATFDVTMKVSKNLHAISNMPAKEDTIDGNKRVLKFHRTPKMSTYLLYLGVGEFEFLEDKLDNILIRIVTIPGKKEQGRFALDLTKKFLSYFQEYSGIPYPLTRLDMIALPDFASGAMENWGSITFREVLLLFDPKITSTTIKKRIAMIIAHELWHQWSGNLVTMKWWNDLWLNESFATFMAYKAVDNFFPEWDMWEDFINDETEAAFNIDSLKTTHPIEVEIKNPHDIEEIFDAISYSKGGNVLRMIEGYLGHEVFRKGVSSYLSKYKYGNATSEDLWSSLSSPNKPIEDITIRWIKQSGHPVVECVSDGNNLVLRQKKFVLKYKESMQWPIPLVIRLSDGKILTELLDKKEKRINLEKAEWFKVNYNQSGFYKVKYSDENLSQLGRQISNKILPSLDRWGVQNDLFDFALHGEIPLDKYMDFLEYYRNEDNYLVLSSIYSNLRYIYFVFFEDLDIWPKFKNHHKAAFRKVFNKLGWEPAINESQRDSLLRELSIRYLTFAEDQEILKAGAEKFENYLRKQSELNPDLRSPIFNMVASQGDENVYKKLLGLYMKSQTLEEKRAVLIAFGQFKNPNLLEKALNFSLTSNVRTQDMFIVVSSVASNPYSRGILLQWIKKNWKKLLPYQKSGRIFLNILESFVSSYVTEEKERELKKFFVTHPVKYKMTLDRAFERVKRNIFWKSRNKNTLTRYFTK